MQKTLNLGFIYKQPPYEYILPVDVVGKLNVNFVPDGFPPVSCTGDLGLLSNVGNTVATVFVARELSTVAVELIVLAIVTMADVEVVVLDVVSVFVSNPFDLPIMYV